MDSRSFAQYTLIAFILLRTPVVGKYIAIIHTLIHEIGHALMAIITGGRVQSIKLFANTSGEAWTRNTRFGQILTTMTGYPFASVVSVTLLYFLTEQDYTTILTIMTAIIIISFILWIRNIYGFLWVLSFLYLLYRINTSTDPQYAVYAVTLIVCIIYVEAVQKALTVFILSLRQPHDAGDASILKRATYLIPAQIWGLLFFIQSLIVAGYGIYRFIL